MELKNYSKSFGIRVPLDLYFKMQTVATKQGTTLTDICLMALFNFGINKDDFSITNFNNKSGESAEQRKRLNDLRIDLQVKAQICDELIAENNSWRKENKQLQNVISEKEKAIKEWVEEVKEGNREISELKNTIKKLQGALEKHK
jgi:septal ring factor EnvC (AmiA/AmiB activator)